MGLDMYLYENSRIKKELEEKIKEKTFNWNDPTLGMLKDSYTITITREGNKRPIPEAILKVATKIYIKQEEFVVADVLKAYKPEVTIDDLDDIECSQNDNGSYEFQIYITGKKNPETIFMSQEDAKRFTVQTTDTAYVYTSNEVVYWRKANQIRQWFVDNLSEQVENCEDSTVTKENLEKLISDCEMVLKNKDNAKEIIPTASGFFFGSTEYDEYYFSDIEYTLEKMKNLIIRIDWENESLYYTEWW